MEKRVYPKVQSYRTTPDAEAAVTAEVARMKRVCPPGMAVTRSDAIRSLILRAAAIADGELEPAA